jgi:DNA-binding protein H-NS
MDDHEDRPRKKAMLVSYTSETRQRPVKVSRKELQIDHFATQRRRGGSVAPKHRNPKDPSQTWAGRGLQTLLVREAIKAGKKLESFLIANGMCAKGVQPIGR